MRNKKRNSPRLANAIKRACEYAHACSTWWYAFRSDDLGRLIYEFAYKADKYDVLNALVCVERNKIVTFCRRDIRHCFNRIELICDGIFALVMFYLIVSLLITLCY